MTTSAIDVPEEVAKFLVKGEGVDGQFFFNEKVVYASKNRIFLEKGNKVRDVGYNHISSVELEAKPRWGHVIWGIILLTINIIPWNESTSWGLLLKIYATSSSFLIGSVLLIGIVLIVIGFKWKNHYVKLNVAGMPQTLTLKGDKNTTGDFFRRVNEGRFQPSNSTSDVKTNNP